MSVLTINAFPSTATITATYDEETITGIGQVVIEANDSTVVSYTVEAQQCTSKSGTFTISGDMIEAVSLNYIGSVSVDTWVPSTGRDTFPTHIAMLGKGGWRSVESNDERDAIPSARREAGMSVYVTSTNKVYILDDDLVTWNELESGKVDDVRLHNVSVVNNKIANLETVRQVSSLPVEPLVAGEIVQYIGNTNANYTNGYFYKQTSRNTTYSNIQFTPLGDYEIDVEVSIEDFTTFVSEVVFNKTDYPITHGRFGYRQATPEVSWYFDGNSGHQHDGFTYSDTPEGFAELGFTVTPPIGPQQGLDYTVENTTTWVWERVDVQPNPTVYESFFRGKYGDWTHVPTDPTAYLEDFHGNTTPLKNDYMVVTDASAYVNPDFSDDPENVVIHNITSAGTPTVSITVGTTTITIQYSDVQSLKTIREIFTSQGYTDIGCEWLQLRYQSSAPGFWVVKGNSDYYINNESTPGTTEHRLFYTSEPATNMFYLSKDAGVAPIALFGGWRFRYVSEWSDKGKNGWKPEYQVEDVLPIASPTEQGIAKLYNTTGTHTDGSMTQKSISDALDTKQNELTPGTNITIEEDSQTGELVISSVAQESFFRGRFENWSNVPTDPTYYEQDLHNPPSKIPEANDYIVVNDMSDWRPTDFDDSFQLWNDSKTYTTVWAYNYDNTVIKDSVVYSNYPTNSVERPEWEMLFGPHNEVLLRRPKSGGRVYVIAQTTLRYNDTIYSAGQTIFSEDLPGDGCDSTHPHTIEFSNSTERKEGTWRMRYQGVWDTDGKNGWKPEYQIENVLPIASDVEPGITKIYSTTGQNTDGTMTQKAISDAIDNINESYFRGKWATWTSVPTDTSRYPEDYNHNRIPTENDYMVVTNASDYTAEGMEIKIYWDGWVTHKFSVNDSALVYMAGVSTWTPFNLENDVIIYIKDFEPSYGHFGIKCNVDMLVDGSVVPAGNIVPFVESEAPRTVYYHVAGGATLSGTWRFAYHGVWSSIGKNGWLPEYQLEEVLPIATDTEPGITKLYTTTGNNTDGTMDQNSITGALDTLDSEKQDNLVEGTGIHLDTVTNEISTQNVVWRKW